MHMVTMPYFTPRRFISRKIVAVNFAPGAAQRMPQRDGAAVDVQRFDVQAHLAYDGQSLYGKGLIQFHQPDVFER